MLDIFDNKYQTKVVKDLGYQFVFLKKKKRDVYQTLSNLVKKTQKAISITSNTISNLLAKLKTYIVTNKIKGKYYMNILKVIDKYWDKIYYKRFYQINKVIKLNKFFYYTSIIM